MGISPSLLEKHLKPVEVTASRLKHSLPPWIDWNDLVGTGALAMVEAAAGYQPEQGPFWPYVKQRIRGAMLDFIRGDRRETCHVELTGVRVLGPDLEREIGRKVDLERALKVLDEQERAVLEFAAEGHSDREIGECLNFHQGSVGRIRRRAQGKVRKEFRKEELVA